MSKDFTAAIQQAIDALQAENKTPSVALVKSRLTETVPMPLIISALQRWKKSGTVPKVELVEKTQDAAARIAELEAQIKALTSRIEALEQRLS